MIITLQSKTPTQGIKYDFNGKTKTLFGGSFFEAPDQGYVTVNLMQEYPLQCDAYVPIKDFSIPNGEQTKQMVEAFEEILSSDKDAFVGCFGGRGRTGLFMACFLKYLGYNDVISQVRSEYHPHAVETGEQMEYVWGFNHRFSGNSLENHEQPVNEKDSDGPSSSRSPSF